MATTEYRIPFVDSLLGISKDPYVSWNDSVIPTYEVNFIPFAILGMLYLPVVFGLQNLMETMFPGDPRNSPSHKKFDKTWLKLPLMLWNLLLAVFSMWGAYHLVPHVLQKLGVLDGTFTAGRVVDSVCDGGCYDHPVAMVIHYFNLSKMPEFVDTVFLRLRKRPVIFLHWYHHIVTMFYCWYGNQVGYLYNCTGMYFAAMNLTIHSFMYMYYFMAAAGYGKQMAALNLNILLTSGQITQMVGGIMILILSTDCTTFDTSGFAIATLMYGSYLLLFAQLFIDKYCNKKSQGTPVEKLERKIKQLTAQRTEAEAKIDSLDMEMKELKSKLTKAKKEKKPADATTCNKTTGDEDYATSPYQGSLRSRSKKHM